MADRRRTPVWKVLNRRMYILGVERELFFLFAVVAYSIWLCYEALLLSLATFAVLLMVGRRITAADPDLMRVIARNARYKAAYDPMKAAVETVEIVK